MTVSSRSPTEVAGKFLKAMELLDYDTAMKFVSDKCEYTNPPPFGTVYGPVGIRAVLEPFFAPTLENEFKILRQSVTGPVVFLERLDRHRLADKWVELPVTGVSKYITASSPCGANISTRRRSCRSGRRVRCRVAIGCPREGER
jgi:limonene-1,2-epoxide hydrolase